MYDQCRAILQGSIYSVNSTAVTHHDIERPRPGAHANNRSSDHGPSTIDRDHHHMASLMLFNRRSGLLVFVLLGCLLFTGIIFGWDPFLVMLERDHQYQYLCKPNEQTPCPPQATRLNAVYTIASTLLSTAALPAGMFLDRFGPLPTELVAGVCTISGLVLLAISDSQHFDAFIPGAVLIAVGGSLCMFAAYSVGFLFPKHMNAILSGVSCLFDASSIVFTIFLIVYNTHVFSRRDIFLAYAGLSSVIFPVTILLWYLNRNDFAALQQHADATDDDDDDSSRSSKSDHDPHQDGASTSDATNKVQSDDAGAEPSDSTHHGTSMHALSFGKQMKSFEFFVILMFATVHVVRSNVFLGTANQLFKNMGEAAGETKEDIEYVTTLFGFLLPCGIFAVPIITWVMNRFSITTACQITNILGIIYIGMAMIPNLWVQIGTSIVYTVYRAFVFSCVADYNAHVFGLRTLGRIQGTVFLVGSVVNLAQYPAVKYVNKKLNGKLFVINLVLLVIVIPVMPLVEILRRRFNASHGHSSDGRNEGSGNNANLMESPVIVRVNTANTPLLSPSGDNNTTTTYQSYNDTNTPRGTRGDSSSGGAYLVRQPSSGRLVRYGSFSFRQQRIRSQSTGTPARTLFDDDA